MALKDFQTQAEYFSGKASEITRQIVFAAIAIIWIFRNPSPGQIIPKELLLPLYLLFATLALDLIHYIIGSVIWGIFCEVKERSVNQGKITAENVDAPNILSYFVTFFFFLKIIVLGFAIYFLSAYFLPLL